MGTDPLPKDLLNMLACPTCKAAVKYAADKTKVVCTKCNAGYEIEDGVPVMLAKKDAQG